MKISPRRAVALVASALALAVIAPAAQAVTVHPSSPGAHPSAVSSTGWRINTVISVPHKAVVLVSLDPVSSGDAWAAGTLFAEYGTALRPLLEHWNGRSWRRVALPAAFASHFSQ